MNWLIICRPRSAISLQLPKKKHSDKRGGRPFTAPASLSYKSSDQKGNLQILSDGFVILKIKTPISAESQKKPRSVLKDISKIPHHTEVPYDDVPAVTRSWHQESSVIMKKGEKSHIPSICESRSQEAHNLGEDGDQVQEESDIRSGSLLKIALSKEIQTLARKMDSGWLLKKPLIPLSIEDEFKKPDAKIIRTDVEGVKLPSPMKVSESFPVYCSNEGYVRKYVLNRWLALYGDKAFYDTSKKDEVHVRLNPVLQNNFNESFAILRSQKHTLATLTTKRKKKPFFPKPKTITSFQILAMERKLALPPHPQKERPYGEKLSNSFLPSRDYSIWKRSLLQKNISETIPKCKKDVFMVHGINPVTHTHQVSTSSLIKKIKSQFPCCTEKPVVQHRKRGKLVHVEYIPISKPISVPSSERDLPDLYPSLSDHHTLLPSDSSDFTLIERDKSKAHPHTPNKKRSLDEGRLGGIEFIVSRYTTLAQGSSERHSRPVSAASPQSFRSESTESSISSKTNKRAVRIISIPTAQFDVPDSKKQDSMDI